MAVQDSLLLLAGAWGAERQPPARAGWEPGWHQPPHVRRPAQAREQLAAQVAAGAGAITAPTYRTARPTLARFGEARRAAEWTVLAVELARQAVELGRERARREAEIIVCGAISPFDGLLEEADEEAFRVHAERVAEAGADVLLIELMENVAESRAATLAAVPLGLPVWSGIRLAEQGTELHSGEGLAAWLDALSAGLPERLILHGSANAACRALAELRQLAELPLGLSVDGSLDADSLEVALDAGATLVGISSGATPETLEPLRQLLDQRLEAQRAKENLALQQRQAWLERAARWAPGGAALWLGSEPDLTLPAGFDWQVAPADDLGRLPRERYRLLVVEPAPSSPLDGSALAGTLERGGILLMPAEGSGAGEGLRTLDRSREPALAILRRE